MLFGGKGVVFGSQNGYILSLSCWSVPSSKEGGKVVKRKEGRVVLFGLFEGRICG